MIHGKAIAITCVFIALRNLGADAYDVRESGAKGDGATLDTSAIQDAMDKCSTAGGGRVSVPCGRYLVGTIVLKNNVTLHLEKGAVLVGSTNSGDYLDNKPAFPSYTTRYSHSALLYAENAHDVAITGEGVIDGQGAAFDKKRPYLIRLVSCDGVRLENVTLRNGAMWTVHFLACDRVYVHGITLRSRCNKNNDGLDVDCSSNVRISDCDISSGDDAIVLKSTSDRPCRNVTIANCMLSSDCNALKMGTESNGGFQNIAIGNCTIYDTRLAGIALEIVDGGIMDGIVVSGVSMQHVGGPIFVRLGDRGRPYKDDMARPAIGVLRNVSISHVCATGADVTGCCIAGLPAHPVENVTLSDIRIEFAGGGTEDDAKTKPDELADKYPEYKMFGRLPAYGFYSRHVKGLRFNAVEVSCTKEDARPAFLEEDVTECERH